MRSYGRFTLKDARLLVDCIYALQDLEEGRRKPKTAMQVQFVSVCKGKAPPRTKYEIAYMRWKRGKPHIPDVLARAEIADKKLTELGASADATNAENKLASRDAPPVQPLDIEEVKAANKRREEIYANYPKKDYEPRKIAETWGSRDAWKRDTARNKYNGR